MTIENILDMTLELSKDEKESLVEILNKRIIEEKRIEWANYYKQIKKDFKSGHLKPKSAEDTILELQNLLNDNE